MIVRELIGMNWARKTLFALGMLTLYVGMMTLLLSIYFWKEAPASECMSALILILCGVCSIVFIASSGARLEGEFIKVELHLNRSTTGALISCLCFILFGTVSFFSFLLNGS